MSSPSAQDEGELLVAHLLGARAVRVVEPRLRRLQRLGRGALLLGLLELGLQQKLN